MYITAGKSKVFGRSDGFTISGALRHPCTFCKPEQQNCSWRAETDRGINGFVGELFFRSALTCSQELSRRVWGIERSVKGGLIPFALIAVSVIMVNSGPAFARVEKRWKSAVRCERTTEYALANEHETRLVASLRRISGYTALEFDPDGSLCLEDTSVVGGSLEARLILASALSSQARFVIEDFSGCGGVTFGQAAPETIYEDKGKRLKLWRLRLDFSDFEQMKACPQVRSTFDEGFTLFHELLHGLGYEDPKSHSELGDCEQKVNLVRSELGLPLRERYFGDTWRMTDRLTSVRLRFKSRRDTARGEFFESRYLFFIVRGPDHFAAASAIAR